MDRGLVLNIQRYCLHDGPGIRTTVFLKGCPLRCPWCHNPESQAPFSEIQLIAARCLRCGACVSACPAGTAEASSHVCQTCGSCVDACPAEARRMAGREMTVAEVVHEVLKDELFHDESNGGVTLSGGEPLGQPDFVMELLKSLRNRAIHTAVDTSGYVPEQVIADVAPLVDLFLYDVKCVDDTLHRQETGVSNQQILDNLRYLAERHCSLWIRIPLVPGFNLDDQQLRAIAEFLATLPTVAQVNLLPYHAWGTQKVERLGESAPRGATLEVTSSQVSRAVELFQNTGLRTLIGG